MSAGNDGGHRQTGFSKNAAEPSKVLPDRTGICHDRLTAHDQRCGGVHTLRRVSQKMMLAATFSNTGRATHRIPTARPATLRDAQRQPIDIFIENLSADGFGMSTTTSLARGERVSLQLAGIEPREARVVRRLGLSYGCEFVNPLDSRELSIALDAGTVLNARFAADDAKSPSHDGETRVSRLGRIGILLCVNVILWTAIVFCLRTLL
jgi:hypothetical protein